jgi:hypothetical protein
VAPIKAKSQVVCPTVVEAMLEQPLLLVTVTEYTPAVVTVAVLPPLTGIAPALK